MQELVKEIYNLKNHRDIITKNIDKYKQQLVQIEADIDEKEKQLLQKLRDSNLSEVEADDLVGFTQTRSSINYVSESDILDVLKTKFNSDYIKVKVTESIDKNSLKKALKINQELSAELSQFITHTSSESVIVTTKDNRQRMLEHINGSN